MSNRPSVLAKFVDQMCKTKTLKTRHWKPNMNVWTVFNVLHTTENPTQTIRSIANTGWRQDEYIKKKEIESLAVFETNETVYYAWWQWSRCFNTRSVAFSVLVYTLFFFISSYVPFDSSMVIMYEDKKKDVRNKLGCRKSWMKYRKN